MRRRVSRKAGLHPRAKFEIEPGTIRENVSAKKRKTKFLNVSVGVFVTVDVVDSTILD